MAATFRFACRSFIYFASSIPASGKWSSFPVTRCAEQVRKHGGAIAVICLGTGMYNQFYSGGFFSMNTVRRLVLLRSIFSTCDCWFSMKCAIFFLAYATFVSGAIALTQSVEAATQTYITRDVAIIGGGAAGTYAAVRLREDYNISVVLIETDDRLVSIKLAFQ